MWFTHIFYISPLLQHSPTLLRFLMTLGLKLGKYLKQYYAFQCCPSLPLSVLFCLAHCISLPSVLLGACCRPLCLNLGVRTHREAGVYSTATPVKNTFPWKCSHPAPSKTPRKTRIAAQLFGLFGRKQWKTAWGFELLFFTGARIKQIMLLFIVSLKQFYENKMC